jgi:S-adenosylmethionine:tRNA ribosyltransferase-isomerase
MASPEPPMPLRTADFDYALPAELIARHPAPTRDQSRLCVFTRTTGRIAHGQFRDLLDYLQPGDALVLNDSKVLPARLRGEKTGSGGAIELLLIEENARNDWWVMLRPGKRIRAGSQIELRNRDGHASNVRATVLEKNDEGHCRVHFTGVDNIAAALDSLGEMPLPPYLCRAAESGDCERYQTVFAQHSGSIAAPTAGLHFTATLLDEIRARGVRVCFVTLHVGLGTFSPVKSETLAGHAMHEERYELGPETAEVICVAKSVGRRVIAVGTTTVRVLESIAARHAGRVVPECGRTRIFIHPPHTFRVVDALVTNFHLPQSTLLMLVSAFAAPGELRGGGTLRDIYAEAIRERYRFYSYGDAMLLL